MGDVPPTGSSSSLVAYTPEAYDKWRGMGLLVSGEEYQQWRVQMMWIHRDLKIDMGLQEFLVTKVNEYNIARAIGRFIAPGVVLPTLTSERERRSVTLRERLTRLTHMARAEAPRQEMVGARSRMRPEIPERERPEAPLGRRPEIPDKPSQKEPETVSVRQGDTWKSAGQPADTRSAKEKMLKVTRAKRQKPETKRRRDDDEDDEYLTLSVVCRQAIRRMKHRSVSARQVVMDKEKEAWARYDPT